MKKFSRCRVRCRNIGNFNVRATTPAQHAAYTHQCLQRLCEMFQYVMHNDDIVTGLLRNIIQHANPAGMVRALMAVVHDGVTPEQAMGMLA